MYDVEGLEKKWKRYKFKQRIPWIVSTALMVLIGLLIVYRADLSAILSKYSKDDNSSTKREEKVQKSISLKPYVPSMAPKSESNQSVQKIDPVKSSEEANQSIEKKKISPMAIEVSDLEAEPVKEHKRKYLKIEVTDRYPMKKKQKEKPKRSIEKKKKQTEKPKRPIEKEKKRAAKSVERNDSKPRSYYGSLYMARTYYKKGNYPKAQKWALIANSLNDKLEESWLIFAKSKAKLGKNREAQQILSAYITKTDSAKAKALLLKIKKEK